MRNIKIRSSVILMTGITAVMSACGTQSTTATPVQEPTSAVVQAEATMEVTTLESVEPTAVVGSTSETDISTETAMTRLNLNTSTAEEYLAAIPDFPNRMTREFLEYRPYVSIEQFRREIGKYVDAAQVAEWEQYIFVPIDVNNSDSATMGQLPGVDEAIVTELIAGRPYDSNEAFLAALSAHVTADEAAAAMAYLQAQ